MSKIITADYNGSLDIAQMTIPCAVLPDKQRVVGERNVAEILGARASGKYWEKRRQEANALVPIIMPEYLSVEPLAPFISNELKAKLATPIIYRQKGKGGKSARAIPADVLPEICDVWIRADKAGVLSTTKQREAAAKAYVLMRGFAHVGVIALVDEATGYQEERARDELQKILEKYIAKELLPWAKRFPDEFYQQIFRLHNWPYDPKSVKRPSVVGKMTNELIYEQLPPGVLETLKGKVPKNEKGYRPERLHQGLSEDYGHPHLRDQLLQVITLMKAAPNKTVFMRTFRRVFPRAGQQEELPLGLDDDE